jgi:hypothetical protein
VAVLVVGGVISGCNLHKKNGPAAPDYSKPNTSTATFTITATGVYSSTYTNTPTITLTPTITFTPTITNTHVNATDTVTNTSTVTSTATVTATPTSTPTACSGSYSTSYTFDSSDMCWKVEYDPNNLSPTAGWDGSAGNASAGSVSLRVPFTGASQQVLYAVTFGSTPTNLTGKRITLCFRVDSWANSNLGTYPGGAKIVVKTGSAYTYGASTWQNILSAGSAWVTLSMDVSTVSGIDPTMIEQIGLELNTNSGGTFGAAVFHIDDVTVTDIVAPTSTATPGGPQGWKFDSSLQSWGIDGSGSTAAVTAAGSLAVWDGTVDAENSSSSGSVSLYVPFTTIQQQFLVDDSIGSAGMTLDLTGKAVTVKVRVDSCVGADLASSPIIAQVVLKSGSGWVYAGGSWVNLTATGTWFDVTVPNVSALTTSANPTFDSSQIIQVGVAFQTGSAGTYGATVFHVDDWLYQ